MSDNETRQKLIDSAKKEFFENGFAKASLRKICTNAGVTTGALYFFFKNNTFILLHHFRKKTQKTPRSEIEKAKTERADFLSREEQK